MFKKAVSFGLGAVALLFNFGLGEAFAMPPGPGEKEILAISTPCSGKYNPNSPYYDPQKDPIKVSKKNSEFYDQSSPYYRKELDEFSGAYDPQKDPMVFSSIGIYYNPESHNYEPCLDWSRVSSPDSWCYSKKSKLYRPAFDRMNKEYWDNLRSKDDEKSSGK